MFGLLAVGVACLGLYGTVAYSVVRRTNEIGVRMALGASRGGVGWLVLRETLVLVAAGGLLGLVVVWPLLEVPDVVAVRDLAVRIRWRLPARPRDCSLLVRWPARFPRGEPRASIRSRRSGLNSGKTR